MGVVADITFESKPKQGSLVGRRVDVCYNYDTTKTEAGTLIRDDRVTIIMLDSGFPILDTECQYSLIRQ
jgi:hypothetical protein